MKFYVIADENTVTGFNLVGLEGEAVESPEGAREALAKAFESSDTGIIIITERLADSIREAVSSLPETPRNGQIPRNKLNTKLFIKQAFRKIYDSESDSGLKGKIAKSWWVSTGRINSISSGYHHQTTERTWISHSC